VSISRRALLGTSLATASAAALAACGGTSAPTAPTGGDIGGDIRFSIWFGEGDIDMWKAVIADFTKLHSGVNVKFEPLDYANFWTKLNTQLAGNNAPDVIGMQFQSPTLGRSNQLADLSQAVADDIDKIPANLAKIGQADNNGATAQFALPWRFVGASLYGNLTALDAAGISRADSWTLDDFVAACKEMTTGKQYGTTIPGGGAQVAIASTFGAAPTSDDLMTATYNTDAMLAHKTFLRDLIYVHKVAPAPGILSDKKDPFATGQVRLTFAGSWNTPVYRAIKDFDWDLFPNPSGQQEAKNYAGPDCISVYAKSKNLATATAFVKYAVFQREAQELIGKTGAPVLTDYLTDSARVEAEAKLKPAHYKYFIDEASQHGAGWAFVPKFADIGKLEGDADYQIMSKPDSDIKQILADLNTKAQAAIDSGK